MAKKRKKRSLLPLLAIGAGIWLLTRKRSESGINPDKSLPSLPPIKQSIPMVQRRKLPRYL